MPVSIQISAYISKETKDQVEAYVKSRGVKKAFLVEEALQHHLLAMREIPEDVIIPARLVLSDAALKQVAARLTSDETPTGALKELFRG